MQDLIEFSFVVNVNANIIFIAMQEWNQKNLSFKEG